MDKVIQDISLCKRAGKLIMGFDVVKESLAKKTAELLLMSNDLSPKTKKEVLFLSEKYNVQIVTINATLDEIWYILGKRVGVLAVSDKSLGEKIKKDSLDSPSQIELENESKL